MLKRIKNYTKRKRVKFKRIKIEEEKRTYSNYKYELIIKKNFFCKTSIKIIFFIFSNIFIIFIIFIIFMFTNIHINDKIDNNKIELENYKKELKEIFNITNITFNKGFLDINTTHKVKFSHYNYTSNIIVYKDLYKNVTYAPITDSNYILKSNQISKEEFSKICEEGVLLDKTKYKRSINPKISVVIPYYNIINISIKMNLRSIQNQSFKDIEIIYVDDGSPENKLQEIFEAMKDDNRIILLRHIERKTTLLTRVDGIRYSSGKYIIQIDQDDMYLNNLLFEELYNKAKELHVDIIQFSSFLSRGPNIFKKRKITAIPKNVLIKQPELMTTFFEKDDKNRLLSCAIRLIWDLFVRRVSYLQAIEDIGDEYMNHRFRFYEDTIMMFELSQVAYSYYFYDIDGIRQCIFNAGKTFDRSRNMKYWQRISFYL